MSTGVFLVCVTKNTLYEEIVRFTNRVSFLAGHEETRDDDPPGHGAVVRGVAAQPHSGDTYCPHNTNRMNSTSSSRSQNLQRSSVQQGSTRMRRLLRCAQVDYVAFHDTLVHTDERTHTCTQASGKVKNLTGIHSFQM